MSPFIAYFVYLWHQNEQAQTAIYYFHDSVGSHGSSSVWCDVKWGSGQLRCQNRLTHTTGVGAGWKLSWADQHRPYLSSRWVPLRDCSGVFTAWQPGSNKRGTWDLPGVQWLVLHMSTAGGAGWIPIWGSMMLHATRRSQNRKKICYLTRSLV